MISFSSSRRMWAAAIASFFVFSLLVWPSAQNYRLHGNTATLLDSYYAKTPLSFERSRIQQSQDAKLPDDKVIVMARTQSEHTEWVAENLSGWHSAIYNVDNTSAALHTPLNKGREANAYLLFLIQHYHNLPSIIVFLHAHRDTWPAAWHNDAPAYDNVKVLDALRLDYVRSQGYINLRCNWIPGCPDELQYKREQKITGNLTLDVQNAKENVENKLPDVWRHFFGEDSEVPEVIAAACCAQFAVTREQVLQRPRSDYVRMHRWLMETEFSDQLSGTLMEYLWHIIFGQEPVHCPQMGACYKDVFGKDEW